MWKCPPVKLPDVLPVERAQNDSTRKPSSVNFVDDELVTKGDPVNVLGFENETVASPVRSWSRSTARGRRRRGGAEEAGRGPVRKPRGRWLRNGQNERGERLLCAIARDSGWPGRLFFGGEAST